MAILSNGKFYGFLCSVKATGRKLSNGVKEYVEDFVSGFAGHGWKLWEYIKGKWKAGDRQSCCSRDNGRF
ncbi:hypothetical protein NXW58_14120 [Bacteroides faecis]|nr:hypothetical protein NXW58_14120 [Bacteroides faecis]